LETVVLARVIAPGEIGKTSVNAGEARAAATAFGFVSVKARTLFPPPRIVTGEKALAIVGGPASTVRLTEGLGKPGVCVWFVRIPEVAFGKRPGFGAATTTVTVQVPGEPAGTVRPEKERAVCPVTNGFDAAPAHVPAAFWLALIAMPARVSVKEAPVIPPGRSVPLFGFESVKVIVLVPPDGIDAGVNDFEIVGLATARSVSVAGSGFDEPSSVTRLFAAIVLTYVPAAPTVTGTVTVQELEAARFPFRTVIVPPPDGASTVVPEQVVAGAGNEATVTPAGRVSTSPGLPRVLGTVFVLLIRIVSVDVPPISTTFGVNDFATLTFRRIVSVADGWLSFVTPWAETRAPTGMSLTWLPSTNAVTLTESVQVEFALIEAPEIPICVAKGVAEIVAPLQPVPENVPTGTE
jgi:hypothetical protein